MYLVFIVGTFTRCFVVKYGRPLFLIYMGGQVTSFILSNRYRRQWRRNEFESGGTDPAPKVDGTDPAQSAGNFFLVVPLHFFGSKSTTSRFGQRFREYSYSLISSCCFSTHGAPPCPTICKSGGTCPPVPYGVGATDHRHVGGTWHVVNLRKLCVQTAVEKHIVRECENFQMSSCELALRSY